MPDKKWEGWYIPTTGQAPNIEPDMNTNVEVTLDTVEYCDTVANLTSTYPTIFEVASTPNGEDYAICGQVDAAASTPIEALINSVAQDSVNCQVIGGHPKPPNK